MTHVQVSELKVQYRDINHPKLTLAFSGEVRLKIPYELKASSAESRLMRMSVAIMNIVGTPQKTFRGCFRVMHQRKLDAVEQVYHSCSFKIQVYFSPDFYLRIVMQSDNRRDVMVFDEQGDGTVKDVTMKGGSQ